MKILTIDIGNTNRKICVVSRGKGGDAVAPLLRDRSDSSVFPEIPEELFPETAILSSVVPDQTARHLAWCRDLLGIDPILLTPNLSLPFQFGIPDPGSLGADRIADAAWAAIHLPLPAVTVDLGTCSTFNVLDRQKTFLGGAIAPGPALQLNALRDYAAKLPELLPEAPSSAIGVGTKECMLSGTVLGSAAAVDGLLDRYSDALGTEPSVVVTGGNAPLLLPYLRHTVRHEPDLLTLGLAEIASLNR